MNRLVERNENKTSEVDAYKNLLEITIAAVRGLSPVLIPWVRIRLYYIILRRNVCTLFSSLKISLASTGVTSMTPWFVFVSAGLTCKVSILHSNLLFRCSYIQAKYT